MTGTVGGDADDFWTSTSTWKKYRRRRGRPALRVDGRFFVAVSSSFLKCNRRG